VRGVARSSPQRRYDADMASFPKEVGISDDVFSANGVANRRRGSQIAIKFRRENYSVLWLVWLDFLSVNTFFSSTVTHRAILADCLKSDNCSFFA
jgi:hypothetical protein